MPDALTESFCERCGTRYEFAAPTRMTPIRRTRGVISGLRNYILSQDSLSDSVGDALRSQESRLAGKQLDAFHSSFNFCIDCRQYTCTNCWNDAAGRCQSCQPLPDALGIAQRLEATMGDVQPEFVMPFGADHGAYRAETAWPASDLTEPAPLLLAGHPDFEPEPILVEVEPEPEPEPVFKPEPEPILVEAEVEAEVEPEPILVEAEVEPEPEPVPEVQPEAEVEQEPEPMFEPEPEPVLVEAEVEQEPEPEPEPEPILVEAEVEPEPEPVPEVQPEPEPLPYLPLRPISDTFLRSPHSAVETDGIAAVAADEETFAARRAQLELLGLGDPGEGPVGPAHPVVLPYRSSGASTSNAERQAAVAFAAGGAFWDASAREVAGAISQIGVRSCGHCELSLSATARFCRRCGTPQSQSA